VTGVQPATAVEVHDRFPDDWPGLVADDASASPAHRPELTAALEAAVPSFSGHVVTVREHGILVGGAPLVVERRGPFRWLLALPWLLPGAPLARAGAHARVDLAVAAALESLANRLHVVGGSWACYRPRGPAVSDVALATVAGRTRGFEAALLPLAEGLAPLRARMGRKQRQALDHALARPYVFGEDAGALDAAFALHQSQSSRWGSHQPLPLELSRRLLRAGPPSAPLARLFTLRSPAGLVAATLALDGPHETFVWWSGTQAEARRHGAFARLLWGVAEWAAARGRARLNLGASTGLPHVATFKSSLGAEGCGYPVRWLEGSHARGPGRWLAALQARRRRGRPMGEGPA